MISVGIDYSISCPCVCINHGKNKLDFFYIIDKKKYIGITKINDMTFEGIEYPLFKNSMNRYNSLANLLISKLNLYNVTDNVGIEGYSFASKNSMIFDIAENTGVFKNKLYSNGIEFIAYSPSEIKKYASR